MSDPEVTTEIIECAECREPIETRWQQGLLPGDYLLIADWIFHPDCWNKIVDKYDMKPEHIPSPDCWCEPEEIEEGVYVHKQVQ